MGDLATPRSSSRAENQGIPATTEGRNRINHYSRVNRGETERELRSCRGREREGGGGGGRHTVTGGGRSRLGRGGDGDGRGGGAGRGGV
jgi:hypothetical protein